MLLKIRYENEYQTLELNAEDTEKLWVSLSLEGDGLTEAEKEQLLQDTWEERFNRPDYNNFHKHERHYGIAMATNNDGSVEANTEEAVYEKASDKSSFTRSIDGAEEKMMYESLCRTIRANFKPETAELIIAVYLNGMSVTDYADSIGDARINASHRLHRADKKLREIFG